MAPLFSNAVGCQVLTSKVVKVAPAISIELHAADVTLSLQQFMIG